MDFDLSKSRGTDDTEIKYLMVPTLLSNNYNSPSLMIS